MERDLDRKVVLTGQPASSSISADPDGQRFRIGIYHENRTIEDSVVCLYLTLPRKVIVAYFRDMRALNHANILRPVSFFQVGDDKQYFKILFENKITWNLKEFVENMGMKLFDKKVENDKIVYGMSLLLQQVIMEIIITFEEMHQCDVVHGRLSMQNTGIYHRGAADHNEDYQTKLFGFEAERFEGNALMMKKNEDRNMLGTLIEKIFKQHNLPMACCANDLTLSFRSDKTKPEGIGFYRGHPNFFNIGNKEAIIKKLSLSSLDGVQHLVRMPTIPAKYSPPPGRRTLEKDFKWLRNEFEHNRLNVENMIADFENINPSLWLQLLVLSNKV